MSTDNKLENESSKISLRKISLRNLALICNLRVKPKQKHLVAPNAYSIAQAHFTKSAWYRAIYLGEKPIGFVMLKDSTLKYTSKIHVRPEVYFWRFMIDGIYQGKGYGKKAMELIIEHIKSIPNIKEVTLHHEPSKGNAGEFYKKLGFKYTGKILQGELEMNLKLD